MGQETASMEANNAAGNKTPFTRVVQKHAGRAKEKVRNR